MMVEASRSRGSNCYGCCGISSKRSSCFFGWLFGGRSILVVTQVMVLVVVIKVAVIVIVIVEVVEVANVVVTY